MKSFATAVVIAASAAIANAQYTYNSTTNVYTCPIANGSYCAGTSLGTNIIIRCTNGVGQPGNCNDNLAGEPPLGVLPADCYQTSDSSGDASCAKNCIVYASAVSSTFSLPSCTPSYTGSSSSVASTSSVEASTTASSAAVVTTTVVTTGSAPTSTVLSNSTIATTSGTSATNTPVGPSTTTSTSAPTTSSTVGFTGAAAANSVGSLIAAAGILAAYFL